MKVGNSSATPKKTFLYNQSDPANFVKAATPTRIDDILPLKSSLWRSSTSDSTNMEKVEGGSRPKTSRGTSHPSPDAFFDYVIPSPVSKLNGDSDVNGFASVMNFERELDTGLEEGISTMKIKKTKKIKKIKKSKKSMLQVDIEIENLEQRQLKQQQEDIIYIGCWLFGAMIRV